MSLAIVGDRGGGAVGGEVVVSHGRLPVVLENVVAESEGRAAHTSRREIQAVFRKLGGMFLRDARRDPLRWYLTHPRMVWPTVPSRDGDLSSLSLTS